MPILIDLTLLVLFAVPLLLGWRRGFFRSVLSLGRLALAFLTATWLGPTAADWIQVRFVYPPVHTSVSRSLHGLADEVSDSVQNSAEALAGKLPAAFRPYLNLRNLDPTADAHALAEEWSATVASRIAHILSTALGYLLVFAVAFALLTVAILVVGGLIQRIPVVRTADRILGLAAGVLIGGIGILLLSSLAATLLTVMGHTDVVDTSLMLRLSAGVREIWG